MNSGNMQQQPIQGLAKLLKSDMNSNVIHDLINIVSMAFMRHKDDGDRAKYIKFEVERLLGVNYAVFVYKQGCGGWSFSSKEGCFAQLMIEDYYVIIFKEVDQK